MLCSNVSAVKCDPNQGRQVNPRRPTVTITIQRLHVIKTFCTPRQSFSISARHISFPLAPALALQQMTSTLDIYNYFTDNWAYSSSRLRPAGSIRHGLSSAGAVLRDLPERENSHSSSSSFNVYTWMCYLATCYRHYAHKKRREGERNYRLL